MYTQEQGLYIAHGQNGPIVLNGAMVNRHGLVAGATGTGKTVSLQVMAESFCQAGVPCFMADMKGDLSGISQAGHLTGFIEKRMTEFGIHNPTFQSCPVRFFDVYGEQGHPMRATISEMGQELLTRLLELNDTQAAILNITERMATPSTRASTINSVIKNYDRVRARDYARDWSCTNGSLYDHATCHNPEYTFYASNDCTNFVSQCLVYGGLPTDSKWKPYTEPWKTTGNAGNGIRQYLTNNGLFFHSTNEKEAFAGSIINWLNSDGTNAGHVGLVDQNDTATMTFCAHTRCRRSCPWTGEKVDFYIPYWDSYEGDWTK